MMLVVLTAALAALLSQPACGSNGDSGNGTPTSADGQALVVEPASGDFPVSGGTTIMFVAHTQGNTAPVPAHWSIDVASAGAIDDTGLFKASGTTGGPLVVTATADDSSLGSGAARITLHLKTAENMGNVDSGTQAKLRAGGHDDAAFAWLYPYDKTVFPRDLQPPTLQFGGAAGDAYYVKIEAAALTYEGFFGASSPSRVALSANAWTATQLSAAAKEAVRVSVTKSSGGKVTGPITETWVFAPGSLRGTVYYNSYNSKLAGNTGAILTLRPGETSAKVFQSGCRVCHFVSANGSTLVSANEPTGGEATDRVFDLSAGGKPRYDAPNRTWVFGALTPNGSKLLKAGSVDGGWPPNVRGLSGEHPSVLYDTTTGANLAAKGIEGVHAMTPAFSPDGKRVAFNHYNVTKGHALAVMDFDDATNTFSNLRTIATIPDAFLGWPTFSPDGKTLIFQAGSRSDYGTNNDGNGTGRGDLYVASVDSKTIALADMLNGGPKGKQYLPYGEAVEGHLNFEPTMLPVKIGGYHWVAFTSRRMYGNTITDPDPYGSDANLSPRKKLWVAAVDVAADGSMATDLTHPAFYLEGQEPESGNMRAFWTLDSKSCVPAGDTCTRNAECCGSGSTCTAGKCAAGAPPAGGLH
jgi:hypothetical protein